MAVYIFRRLIQALAVVIGVTIIVFIVLHLLPGGPRALLGPRATAQQIKTFMDQNGYNRPVFTQYFTYVYRFLHGNLGYSYHYNQSVTSLLATNLPKSALLAGLSYTLAIALAVPLGVLQGARRNKLSDYALTSVALVAYSMPVFWLGILLILCFSGYLHVLPPEGPQGTTLAQILQQPVAMVLPVVTLAIPNVAWFSRFIRSSVIENLVQDYVRTARAIGASDRRVLFLHVLRNSLLPVITLIGVSIPLVIAGAIVTESVFNYPGMGLLYWTAATYHDYPVLLGFTLVVGVATVIGSLIADLLYAVVDPRIRFS
jgi:peptide/nickel transport system permease protein